ncbi:MAG: hypothetical protein OEU32_10375 [Acidimicrobiia bacterium]|nr:hypothetical protein [Acidimicrobiia bacterium]
MTVRRLAALTFASALLVAACGGDTEDPGDQAAFCDLLREGVGLTGGAVGDFERLADVAPPDIRLAVRELGNTARSLDDIPDENLEELFAAAFDPEAVEAGAELDLYAVEVCGSDPVAAEPTPAEDANDSDASLADLEDYIAANFSTTTWAGNVQFDVAFEFGRLDSIEANFDRPPDSADDALAACNAVAVFLYELRDATGTVAVVSGDDLLASRSGPDTPCVRP